MIKLRAQLLVCKDSGSSIFLTVLIVFLQVSSLWLDTSRCCFVFQFQKPNLIILQAKHLVRIGTKNIIKSCFQIKVLYAC